MRGPLLSGPLGSAASVAALGRWTDGASPLVVLGPVWLAETLAATTRVLFLDEPDDRRVLVRARRRADKISRPLAIAIAGADLPLRRGSLGALVVENAAGLPADEAARWIAALVPCLRPGGRLVAVDATRSSDVAARVAGVFLSAALIDLAQEWPRDGVVVTVGAAPAAVVVDARFGIPGEQATR
ncbi:MAG TPA: hypothetical protein VG319_01820 [Polyangia bacterium]|jgi:hypothetical protein|nr:hypothetical protein [Polyangia bacterium]